MPKYVCTQLIEDEQGNQICMQFSEYQNSIDMLAITEQQATVISTAILVAVFSTWAFRQVHNLILRRRF